MDYSPFLRNRWYQQQPSSRQYTRSPSVRGIPVHAGEPLRPAHPIQRPPVKTSSQKVVQIPVHFVGSESTFWASALKIQKAFRAFLVRKSVKKIKDVKIQVDEIEAKLLKSEVVELLKRDEKERLKMNESLMALLFKLDSVRGLDLGVRDLRKVVIRKAIALQEKIDAVVSVNSENVSEINEVDEPSEATDQAIEIDSEKLGYGNSDSFYVPMEHPPKLYDSAEENSENLGNSTETENSENIEIPTDHLDKLEEINEVDKQSEATDQAIEIDSEKLGNGHSDNFYVPTERSPKMYDSAEKKSQNLGNSTETENSDNIRIPTDHSGKLEGVNSADQILECMLEQNAETEDKTSEYQEICGAMEAGVDDELNVDEENGSDNDAEAEGKAKLDQELLEKMMTQLTEKNERQTQMLNALTRRVELLEKAFVCDMIIRKKKKMDEHSARKKSCFDSN